MAEPISLKDAVKAAKRKIERETDGRFDDIAEVFFGKVKAAIQDAFGERDDAPDRTDEILAAIASAVVSLTEAAVERQATVDNSEILARIDVLEEKMDQPREIAPVIIDHQRDSRGRLSQSVVTPA